MLKPIATTLLFCGLLAACSPTVMPPGPAPSPMSITVGKTMSAPVPATGAVTRTTLYQSQRTVTQMLRLSPNSQIAEHHHPFFDETFVVTQGRVALTLNGNAYEIGAGEFIVMPAGTVIRGRNADPGETIVVVTFSNTGTPGPLSVPGAPSH